MARGGRPVRWTESKTLQVSDSQSRPPAPGEVQLAVGSVGICGSDLHLFPR